MLDYYRTPQWQAIKQAAIEAAGGKCEFCGAAAETAHHVKYPKSMGTEDPRTLIATCWRCHSLLHGRRLVRDSSSPSRDGIEDVLAKQFGGLLDNYSRFSGGRLRISWPDDDDPDPENFQMDPFLSAVAHELAKGVLALLRLGRPITDMDAYDEIGGAESTLVEAACAEYERGAANATP